MKTPIITGRFKGRQLVLPSSAEVRPTRLRLRQSAFNMLESRLDFNGLVVADICCGSGAWGLEALSRGAAHVYGIDTDLRPITTNTTMLGVTSQEITLVKADAAQWAPPQLCQLVMADPPYPNTTLMPQVLAQAARWGTLGSWWLIETASTTAIDWPRSFVVEKTATSGTTTLHLAQFQGE
jgi:16S rRNA (guanine966-N2)-methyltransferase